MKLYRQRHPNNKYNAQPQRLDGYTFDSQAEARRYQQLKFLALAGDISNLVVHPRYNLLETFKNPTGATVRGVWYEADFAYTCDGHQVVEDVKGVETEAFKIKAKFFQARYPDFDFRIIKE